MTINIIKKWENIGENYLNSNLEYTSDRSQKITLDEAINKSIENFPNSMEKKDIRSAFEAIYRVSQKVEKKSSKNQLVIVAYNAFMKKICSKLLDEFSFRDLNIYMNLPQKNNQKINQEISQNPQVISVTKEIKELQEKIFTPIDCSDDLHEKHLKISLQLDSLESKEKELSELTSKLKCELINEEENKNFHKNRLLNILLCNAVKKEPSSRGIIYEIKNKKGCISYLIGTNHTSSKNVNGNIILGGKQLLNGTIIPEKVQHSSEFISECGNLALDKALKPNSMDYELCKLARAKNIPIHDLETVEENFAARSSLPNSFLQSRLEKKIKKIKESEKLSKLSEDYDNNPLLSTFDKLISWKRGDFELGIIIRKIEATKSLRSIEISEASKKRNKNWLTNTRVNLLSKLENTEDPISIAVGAGHLYGKTGFLKAFQDQGLKIQQI